MELFQKINSVWQEVTLEEFLVDLNFNKENTMNNGMKKSTLQALLRTKISAWLESIEDLSLRASAANDVILSGGAIASGLMGEKINDYDLYFRTQDTAFAIAEYYCGKFKAGPKGSICNVTPTAVREDVTNSKGFTENRVLIRVKSAGAVSSADAEYKYFESQSEVAVEDFFMARSAEKPIELVEELQEIVSLKTEKRYRPVFLTDNAISLSDKVQLVIRFSGEPDELHENYDFIHAMCYYDYRKDELNIPKEALESMMSKTLVYGGSLYPIASLFRIRKFISRGWRINAGQMLKIIFQASKLDLEDLPTLREQLLGVDMAYMHQLISHLNNKEPGQKIDSIYFAKLVDEVFEK